MFLAHGPISYILNEKIQQKGISKLTKQEHIFIMILSLIFGILPDLDLAILTVTDIPPFQHHLIFSHSLLFFIFCWLLLILVLYLMKSLLNTESRQVLNDRLITLIHRAFLIGVLSHLFADILFSYSQVLYPLAKQFTIFGSILSSNYFAGYFATPSFALELISVSIFLLLIYLKYLKHIPVIKTLLYTIIGVSTIWLFVCVYMNLNTYNKSFHMTNGQKAEDMDYDGIQDMFDSDTNNNDINNIFDVNKEQLVKSVTDLSNGKYLTSSDSSFSGEFKHFFGAFNSYRLISQAYFEQNLPIEPVLKEYAKNKYNIQSYTLDIEYPTLLYEYFNDMNIIDNSSNENGPGNIFFVLNGQGDVVNMGILLDDEMVGIVLQGDERLVTHTKEDIKRVYEDSRLSTVQFE